MVINCYLHCLEEGNRLPCIDGFHRTELSRYLTPALIFIDFYYGHVASILLIDQIILRLCCTDCFIQLHENEIKE